MIPVLDSAAMREADRITIDELGVPSLSLMELAASAVTEAVSERLDAAGPVVIVCGVGNNGGDGLAVARQLRARGVAVEVVQDERCVVLMRRFIAEHPELWNEDIGV